MANHRFLITAVLLLAVAGCAPAPEALITRQIGILDETADTLSTISDEESAQSAAPRLAGLRRELDELVPSVKALLLTTQQREELEDQHREEMQAALAKFESQLARVLKLDLKVGGLSDLQEALAE